jgi:hypothetical protein
MQVGKSLLDPPSHNYYSLQWIGSKAKRCARRRHLRTLALALLTLTPLLAASAAAQDSGSNDSKTDAPVALKSANATARHPAAGARQSLGSRFGLAFTTSTLGLGGDLAVRIVQPVNLRIGFSTFKYGQDGSQDGVSYHGMLKLQSMRALVDLYPFGQGFHVSPGLLFHNANHVTASAAPPTGTVLSAGDRSFISDPQNPIVGSAKSRVHSVAPMLMVGFGSLLPKKSHFAYSLDVGVVYQGSPQSSFTLAGGACDPSGQFCGNVANDAGIQGQVQSARHDLNSAVSFMRYYPLFSVSVGYHF